MKTILEALASIEARAEKVANVRSDDFGHSCEAMRDWLEAESQDFCSTDIPALCAALRLAVEWLTDLPFSKREEALTEIASALGVEK